jgi:DNA-binding response OmpR family regulator
VDVTLTADAARSSFAEHSPSVAVVDLLISGGAGLDLCRYFKEQGDVLVIAVSALAARDQAVAAGADAFLLKPLEPLQLVSAVRDLLGSSAMLRATGEAP